MNIPFLFVRDLGRDYRWCRSNDRMFSKFSFLFPNQILIPMKSITMVYIADANSNVWIRYCSFRNIHHNQMNFMNWSVIFLSPVFSHFSSSSSSSTSLCCCCCVLVILSTPGPLPPPFIPSHIPLLQHDLTERIRFVVFARSTWTDETQRQ